MRSSLRDYVRQVLLETVLVPPDPRGFKAYYNIDPKNPPPIQDIIDTWVGSHAQVYDSCINDRNPAMYPTKDLSKYREYESYDLRNPSYTEEYQKLFSDIQTSGIKYPLIIEIGANGRAKIGEGNHRHQIALELGLQKVPVRFIFRTKVTMVSDLWRSHIDEEAPTVDDLMKMMGH